MHLFDMLSEFCLESRGFSAWRAETLKKKTDALLYALSHKSFDYNVRHRRHFT